MYHANLHLIDALTDTPADGSDVSAARAALDGITDCLYPLGLITEEKDNPERIAEDLRGIIESFEHDEEGKISNRETVTVLEAAKILGIGRNTAYDGVANGTIPSIKIGRRMVVPLEALKRMLRQPSNG